MIFIQILLPIFSSMDCVEVSAMGYSKLGKYPINKEIDCRFSKEKKKQNIPRKKIYGYVKGKVLSLAAFRGQSLLYFNIFCKYIHMQEYILLHMTI